MIIELPNRLVRSVTLLTCAMLSFVPLAARGGQATPPTTTPAPTPAPAAPTTPAPPTVPLPDAKEILAKSVDAIGGREAWSKRQSMEMKGTLELPGQGIKGTIIARTAQPNKMSTTIELAGIGAFRTGFDGTTGWSSDKISGARLMLGKELETIAREADYLKDVDPLRRWEKVETVGEGKFGNFDCWKVLATKGEEKSTLWFEKSTSLPRGFEMIVDTQLGKLPVVTIFVEYKEFDGIKLPVRSEASQAGQKIVTVYETITLDSVPPTTFDLPPEIKALLEPEPADEDEGAPTPPVAPAPPAAPAPPVAPAPPAAPKSNAMLATR